MVALCVLLTALSAAPGSQSAVKDWVVVAPDNGGFSVKMPVKPSEEISHVPLMGNRYLMRLYSGPDSESGLFYVTVMQEYPSIVTALESAARLDKFIEGFRSSFGEALAPGPGKKLDMTVDRDLELAGHRGRQYNFKVAESPGVVRFFDATRRVYVLMVIGASEKHADVNRFFSSFEIKPAPDPVPLPLSEAKPSSVN